LFLKQWSFGVANQSIEDIIRSKKMEQKFTWFPITNKYQFYADPFMFRTSNNQYCVLYEDYSYNEQYGKISMAILDEYNKPVSTKIVLDTKSHLSYPGIFIEDQHIYVFPEAGTSGKLSCYYFDEITKSLKLKSDIINLPLTDATLLKHNKKYWIFSTLKGENSNKQLHIFYSDTLFGPYISHQKNPVKNNINGSRPAGSFICVDNKLFRPSQNSDKYYGSSIGIYKILQLDEKDFIEEYYMSISPSQKDGFNFGLHTINHVDNLIVIDGLRKSFLPITQLVTYIRKKLKYSATNNFK
jgi:hypothetical protein